MASDTPHKQEFRIRDLSTRSVVLFPTRAQIIREIKDITLLVIICEPQIHKKPC